MPSNQISHVFSRWAQCAFIAHMEYFLQYFPIISPLPFSYWLAIVHGPISLVTFSPLGLAIWPLLPVAHMVHCFWFSAPINVWSLNRIPVFALPMFAISHVWCICVAYLYCLQRILAFRVIYIIRLGILTISGIFGARFPWYDMATTPFPFRFVLAFASTAVDGVNCKQFSLSP